MLTLPDTELRYKPSGIFYGDKEVMLFPIEDALRFGTCEYRTLAEDNDADDPDEYYYCHTADLLHLFRDDEDYRAALDFLRDGFCQPLILAPHNDRLQDGHHRLAAAVDLGYSVIPVMLGANDEYFTKTLIDTIVTKDDVWE